MVLQQLTQKLQQGECLSPLDITSAVEELVSEKVDPTQKSTFLIALSTKGETREEIEGFARELQARSIRPLLPESWKSEVILDVCGTGGDRLNTFNISTTVALVLAAAGVRVAKHGNRAVTSQSGSADVLEALGIPIQFSPAEAVECLGRHHFAFFWAPAYHPAFKHIGPARKLCAEQGKKTLFNFLGPLLNPVRPSAQLLGVSDPRLCEPMAHVLQKLGVRRGMVVCGEVEGKFLDEYSTLGDTRVAEFYQEKGFHVSLFDPSNLPLQTATLANLSGGSATENATIISRILEGIETGPRKDAVLLNTAAGLFVAGQVKSMAEGWEAADETIRSGKAFAKLKALRGG